VGVSKFPKLRLSWLWGPITLSTILWLRWCLKKSCILHRKLSNNMSHATYMQGNWGDSWLLVVKSQTANLTFGPSFGHNLCLKCPNGSCEPILDIYVPKDFNDVRNSSIQWVLTLAIALWRFRIPSGLQFPKWELTWECGGSFPHTLLHFREHEMWFPTFIFGSHLASPCFGGKLKARVVIFSNTHKVVFPM
jgi:hypothetical protein